MFLLRFLDRPLTNHSFKDQMWQKVATEMGIPWRSAESMHWQLGEQEMSARANAPVFQLHPSATSSSSPSQNAAIPAPVPASASHGFTPANAAQLMHNPPTVSAHQYQATPPRNKAQYTPSTNAPIADRARAGVGTTHSAADAPTQFQGPVSHPSSVIPCRRYILLLRKIS